MIPGKKPDFLDDVADEMGSNKDKYGADMESDDGDGMDDESDPADAQEDRIMAAKTLMKGLGVQGDPAKVADALAAFVKSCM